MDTRMLLLVCDLYVTAGHRGAGCGRGLCHDLGGVHRRYKELIPVCEAQIGEKIVSAYGSSMGAAPELSPRLGATNRPTSSSWRPARSTA